MSCNYHGQMFGANYPDACCVDGYLWDEDSCDEPGGPLTLGGEIPCPNCNEEEAVERIAEQMWDNDDMLTREAATDAARARIKKHIADMQAKWGFFDVAINPDLTDPKAAAK